MRTPSLEEAAKAKIDVDAIRYHLRAAGAWDDLVRARNKGVGVTEEEISAAIAKGDSGQVANYRLQQVIFVLPVERDAGGGRVAPSPGQGVAQPVRGL